MENTTYKPSFFISSAYMNKICAYIYATRYILHDAYINFCGKTHVFDVGLKRREEKFEKIPKFN